MTYLLDRNRKRKNIKLFFGTVLFFIVIVFWSPVKNFSYPVLEPVLIFVVSIKDFVFSVPENISVYFHSKNYYDNRIKNLEQNVEDLENKLANDEDIIRSQDLLNDVRNNLSTSTKSPKIIITNPLLKDWSSIYDTIILSKGFSDGVSVSDIVYIRGMNPVGKIEKVHSKTSELYLFSAGGNKIDGVLKDEKSIPLVGVGGGNFIANLPKDFSISIGDNIYYASKGGGLIGTVSDIKNEIQDTFLKVYVKGKYNPMDVNNFYIEQND